MDVKNVFLNGDLSEEVYMKPPLGYFHPLNRHSECGLRSLVPQSSNLFLMPILMTLHFFSATPTRDVFSYYSMLMI